MNNQHLALRVKELRLKRGYTQEQLAEESKLSLRTIQRIEKGESLPRGDTLVYLTNALKVAPEDILEFADIEDTGYLRLLHLSALGYIFHPLLGVAIPLVMWILNKDKIRGVREAGRKIINFQITYVIFLGVLMLVISGGKMFVSNYNYAVFFRAIYSIIKGELFVMIIEIYFMYNFILIIINTIRLGKGKKEFYKPAIPFIK
ncbi:DUF4870 domain-containing protein [Zhouia sp. PK063]|uniref:DUF4870 domain-containing protein n=1 Tax=Zhouia sp. PK063 TaxID=3373602 RepID=UPI0037A098B3